eukprot:GHVN01073967.1.p3 GENE.GHVN01073967.1~~GHVN01073967.1.p3  ORF type:complete len:199 (-),score=16.27 GHVN01073967.1:1380-1976(-)
MVMMEHQADHPGNGGRWFQAQDEIAPLKRRMILPDSSPLENAPHFPHNVPSPSIITSLIMESTDESYHMGIINGLGTCEHVVLGAFSRLHTKKMVPKTFARVVDEVSTLSNFSNEYGPRVSFNPSSLRGAFLRLAEFGIIESTAYKQIDIGAPSIVSNALGSHVPCRFPLASRYKKSLKGFRLPTELQSWIENAKTIR